MYMYLIYNVYVYQIYIDLHVPVVGLFVFCPRRDTVSVVTEAMEADQDCQPAVKG